MSHPLLSTATSTTTTSSCCSSQSPSSGDKFSSLYIENIIDTYKQAIGTPNQLVISRIKQDILEHRIPHQYYTYALEQTAFAPRPSFAYCQAIIRRLCRERVDPRELSALPY